MTFLKTSIHCIFVLFLTACTIDRPNIDIPVFSHGFISEQIVSKEEETPRSVSEISFSSLTGALDQPTSIIMVGDVMLARNVEYLMKKNGYSYPFEGVSFDNLSPSPLVVGNFEAAILKKHVYTKPNQLKFSVDKKLLVALDNAGFTHFSLANNHSTYQNENTFLYTKEKLEEVNLETFGDPRSLNGESIELLHVNDHTVALVGLQIIDRILSEAEVRTIFKKATEMSDMQIAYVHWGIEYKTESSETQQRVGRQLVEAGADLVVGHHPHVTQEIGFVDGVPIIYSLGNYIFDQYFSSEVQQGLILNIDLSKQTPEVRLLPVTSNETLSQPRLMTPQDATSFLAELSAKSSESIADFVNAGVLPLYMSFATSTKIAIMSR